MTKIENQPVMIGAVVIGRNEGQRLLKCLDALLGQVSRIVYVDSGSTDNSITEAQARGVHCITLDLSIPFTAARARNEGASYLIQHCPDIKYIQFIDGDCELQSGWIDKAHQFLDNNPEYAVVCGRRRERFPEQSIYNQLCDIEWDTPVGEALACGGDALIRVHAYKQVNGYRDDLIAGEEPEMCFRLRERGWKIYRLDAEMTLHDAAMTQFSQWWKRAKRAGYAYAVSCYLHGNSEESFKVREVISIVIWACVLPVLIIFSVLFNIGFIAMLALYLLQVIRLTIKYRALNKGWKVALSHALFIVIAKFPQSSGIIEFLYNKIKGVEARLIEYK